MAQMGAPQSYSDVVIRLLAMTIYADKRVLPEEGNAFVKSVLFLQREKVISSNYSEARILLNNELQQEHFTQILTEGNFAKWFNICLEELKDFPHKAHLFEAILNVSRADNEEHVSEKALAMLVARHWGMEDWVMDQFNIDPIVSITGTGSG